jgi:hypothetical protein
LGAGETDNHVCWPVCFLQSSEWIKRTLSEMEIVVVLIFFWDNDAGSNEQCRRMDGSSKFEETLGLNSLRLQGRNTAASAAKPPAGR